MAAIIGSSNVYRFYKPGTHNAKQNYSMVRCTDIVSFKAIMTNLESTDTEIIVSVIENFLTTAAKSDTTDEARIESMGGALNEFLDILKTTATKYPQTKFAVAKPIWRPKFDWYQKSLDDLQHTLNERFAVMTLNNLTKFEAIPEGCQQFTEDQVHLTPESGKIFVDGLISGAENFFDTELIVVDDAESDAERDAPAVEKLERRIAELEGRVQDRQNMDNLIFARMREDLDTTSNKSKEDRIIITGISSKTSPPTEIDARKIWIREIVEKIFKDIVPDFAGQVHYVNQMKNNGVQLPMVEVKLDSVTSANSIRKAFAEKRKADINAFGRLFIANSVNLATRVRVDILKALARKITDKDITAHTVPFISRPVMHVRSTDPEAPARGNRTYTFVDAVSKFGHLVKQVELGEAYRRAGNSFKGQMEQQFIILREAQTSHGGRAQGYAGPSGSRKRPREEDDDEIIRSSQRGHSGRGYGRGRWRRGLRR